MPSLHELKLVWLLFLKVDILLATANVEIR